VEAGCFPEKVGDGKNSKPVFVLELLEFIYEYEYSNYVHKRWLKIDKKAAICLCI